MQGLISWLEGEGEQFERSAQEVAAFAEVHARALQNILDREEPGFDHAVRFAANSVAMYAGLKAIAEADRVDRMRREAFVRSMSGVLSITARALAMLAAP